MKRMSRPLPALLVGLLVLAPACKSERPAAAPPPTPGSAEPASSPAVGSAANSGDAGGAGSGGSEQGSDHHLRSAYRNRPVAPNSFEEPTPEAIRALHKERIGGVTLGMTQPEVIEVLGAPTKKTRPALLGNAKNEYGVTWTWPGIKAGFGSATKVGRYTLRDITFRKPSKATTARGIGIGSLRKDVRKAYASLEAPPYGGDPRFFVAGASQNGISFNFDDKNSEFDDQTPEDKVTSIEASGGAED
ncbi:MAG TPA: hypothetical protein VK427_21095 [Kofleriaceae bacterium]|nr:hypothetical protein [Kofleriaceae bacterium]